MKKGDTTMKTLRLRQEVVNKVQSLAEKDNRTFTNMVETILIDATKQQQQTAL